jgi:isoquinoline 1-oxidoreductase alpha subunit
MQTIAFTLNGRRQQMVVDETRRLLWILRTDLGLTGTKFACGRALCGACTVLVNEQPMRSCQLPMSAIDGQNVRTIEGLGQPGHLHPLQQAFIDQGGFQCGFCTPGMLMAACALLRRNPAPDAAEIATALDGNLCRCGSHTRIVAAIQHVARQGDGQ